MANMQRGSAIILVLRFSLLMATVQMARAKIPIIGERLLVNAGRSFGRQSSVHQPIDGVSVTSYSHARRGSSAIINSNLGYNSAFASLPSITSFQTTQFQRQHYNQPYPQNFKKSPITFLTHSKPTKKSWQLACSKNPSPEALTGAAYHASVNQQIAQRRNDISKQKKRARQNALDKDRERNMKLRSLFSTKSSGTNNGTNVPPPMFAVKVVTCPTLRADLKMNGREKRGRMFVERPAFFSRLMSEDDDDPAAEDAEIAVGDDDDTAEFACTSLKALRQTIHEFFRRLKKSTYLLSASLPTLDEEGNVLTHADDLMIDNDNTADSGNMDQHLGTWTLESDEDVQKAFAEAEDFFLHHRALNETSSLKRPTIVLHVTKDPNAPLPPPPPPYLEQMPDPHSSPTMTMLSFYAFPPGEGIENAEATADQLKRLWRPFRALGRIYVAKEGVNAQMAVPTNVLSNFLSCCTLSPEKGGELSHILGPYMENGINIDPVPVDMEEFRDDPAFKNMHIRVRSQIVADGFEEALDWQSAGYDMPPMEWHQKLKEAREAREKSSEEGGIEGDGSAKPLPIVLDCRNNYETQVGKFELAEPLDTENFRESWDVLKERLKDTPKDAPIMTYCTGGIRCVKVNAYLTQELEFTNVARLAGGVVAYDRTLNEEAPSEEPMFKGVNYVFDGRMGRRITDDQLGSCYTCGAKTHLMTNCENGNCHRRMVQCEHCSEAFHGTCSEACKKRVISEGRPTLLDPMIEEEKKEEVEEEAIIYESLDDYSSAHSTDPAPLLREIEANTRKFLPSGAHMVSGSTQGSLLTTLASMSREGRILEIGTFTGYATACFLRGAAAAGKCLGTSSIGSRESGGPFVLSLERDRRALGVASAHLKVMADFGIGVDGGQEASKFRLDGSELKDFDGDSISFTYDGAAGCELLQVNDALAAVEQMASDNPPHLAFDIVFVDADKTRMMEYVDALVSNDCVLKKGGLIIVDNVLWKGLVLDASSNGYDSSDEENEDKALLKKNRRARKLANKMHRFNKAVVKDERVEVLMMNLRDGLSMIRKH